MNAAVIILTILGCDDSGAECHYVATLEKRWPSIEMCSANSEGELARYANVDYPVVIAVCQEPHDTEIVAVPDTPAPGTASTAVTEEGERSMAIRAISRVKAVLPTTEGVRTLMQKPVRLVEESYSWVARKF